MLAPSQTIRTATIDSDGAVEGYASLFHEVNSTRDMVMPGAFAQTLRTRGLRRIPMLFQHDPAEPIGVWLDLYEDARGLRARGRLIADVARAREVLALVRAGAIDGLSIGFRTVRGRIDPRTRVRRLEQIDLWEISIVTFCLRARACARWRKGRADRWRDARRRRGVAPSAPGARLRARTRRAAAPMRGWRAFSHALYVRGFDRA